MKIGLYSSKRVESFIKFTQLALISNDLIDFYLFSEDYSFLDQFKHYKNFNFVHLDNKDSLFNLLKKDEIPFLIMINDKLKYDGFILRNNINFDYLLLINNLKLKEEVDFLYNLLCNKDLKIGTLGNINTDVIVDSIKDFDELLVNDKEILVINEHDLNIIKKFHSSFFEYYLKNTSQRSLSNYFSKMFTSFQKEGDKTKFVLNLFGYPFSLENDIFTLSFLGEQVDEVILIDGLNRLKKLFN